MNDNRMKNLYFCFTFLLCACAGLSAVPLIGKVYLAIFLGFCAVGVLFSQKAGTGLKKNIRNIFGWILLVGLPVFLWKISLQQSTLPNLIKLFIIIIMASCFIIESPSTLSLVHFECIFITIFSACLPFIIHPRYQVALFGFGLFLIIVLLQITQIKTADNQSSQYIISNVSIARRFVMSFVISLLIVGIGSLVFFIVPKYSFQLDLNTKGSSLVDFKLKPKSNLRLMLPYKGGEKELNQDEVVPYVRSLFVKPDKAEKLMSFEDHKWKNPLILKEKNKEQIMKNIEQGNSKKGLVSDGDDISKEDENEIVSKALDTLESKIKTQIKDLKQKINKQKKLYNLMSFMGQDDPVQAGKAKKISEQIKKNLKKLLRLNKELKKEQGLTVEKNNSEKQGPGDIGLLAKLSGSGENAEQEKEDKQGDDFGDLGSGDGQDGSGDSSGQGQEGSGDGQDGSGDGSGQGQDGSKSGVSGSIEGLQNDDYELGKNQGEQGNSAGEKGTGDGEEGRRTEEQNLGLNEPGDIQGQKKGNQADNADNNSGNIPSDNGGKLDINDELFSSEKSKADQGFKKGVDQSNGKLEKDKSSDQLKLGDDISNGSGGGNEKGTGGESAGSGSDGNKSGSKGDLLKKIKTANKGKQGFQIKDNVKIQNKADRKKAKVPVPILTEPLVEEQVSANSSNNFFWNLFIFFAVLFCGGIFWALLYVLFCLFRKIFRDLKFRYFLMFKLDKIINYLYRNLLAIFKKTGLKSHEFLTPKEIGNIAVKKFNLSAPAIEILTNEFEKSRYSNHKITKNDINTCINAYNQLKLDIIKNNKLFQAIMLKLDMVSIKKRRKL